MNQSFSYVFSKGPGHDLVELSGIIDAQAENACAAIQKQISSSMVILDFSKVGRVNSMGIALLLRCLKYLKNERNIGVHLQGMNQMNAMLCKMRGVFLLAKEVKHEDH